MTEQIENIKKGLTWKGLSLSFITDNSTAAQKEAGVQFVTAVGWRKAELDANGKRVRKGTMLNLRANGEQAAALLALANEDRSADDVWNVFGVYDEDTFYKGKRQKNFSVRGLYAPNTVEETETETETESELV